ncbi:tyramine oxidase [Rhizobiales bacterium]|uniref:copper amine oxidase n=1 Tax=Hongsoonwoonella zoysiae TaxID=2821844 RepID=UPI0015618488|nr:tyramine oxidase [Hongsoonwoonella zoysiae]NRG19568.1 tyramine oxidase [Hongsoonwoonella zoysiae]
MKFYKSGTGIAAAAGMLVLSAANAYAHPLDGLSEAEISQAVQLLKSSGNAGDDTLFPYITLKEPEKSVVLAWKEGDPEPRAATVHFKTPDGAFVAEVDLAGDSVVSIEPAPGETMILLAEFLTAMELATGAPEFVAGLEKRGLTADQVFCLPLTAGRFGLPEEEGRRLMKVPCYLLPEGSNFYAKPIEGLYAVVDLNAREVVEVFDTGAVPVPEDPWGYTDEEVERRTGALRPQMNAAKLSQPEGANFTVESGFVNWDIWRFRVRVDKRPGVVISNIDVNDDGDWRSVLYQAHLSEVFVPYMDPDEGWYWRTYMDSGEYGFGIFLTPLRAGVDCPAYGTYLPAVVHQDDGSPLSIPDAICIFERNIGDPAWRHYEIFAQSEDQAVPAEGRPATQLVVRSASEVGNYDYLVDYIFHQDGRIDVMVGSTGLDAVKGAAAKSMNDEGAEDETRFGTLIAPNLIAPNHDHYFNFKLDFDVDGRKNTFMRTGLVAGNPHDEALRRSFWVTETKLAKTEMEGRYKINPSTPAMYHVMNMNAEGSLGHKPGYMIVPNNSVAYGPLDFAADPPMKRNAYIEYTIWNTPYNRDERYAGGEFAFQSDGSDTLAAWVEKDRPIDNTDVVTWYTMGFHHIPHTEDWPVMSTMWKGFMLRPFNFFDHNPALTIRTPER